MGISTTTITAGTSVDTCSADISSRADNLPVLLVCQVSISRGVHGVRLNLSATTSRSCDLNSERDGLEFSILQQGQIQRLMKVGGGGIHIEWGWCGWCGALWCTFVCARIAHSVQGESVGMLPQENFEI